MELTLIIIIALFMGGYIGYIIRGTPTRQEEERDAREYIKLLDNRSLGQTPDMWQKYNQQAAKELEDLPPEK